MNVQNGRNGELIRSYRRTAGLKLRELAPLVGVSVSAVGQWERGEVVPEPANIRKLDDVLNAGGRIAQAYGLLVDADASVDSAIAALREQVEALRRELAARDELAELHTGMLADLLARVARLEDG